MIAVTLTPSVLRSKPVEDAMIPFPIPLMPPPVTRTYFIFGDFVPTLAYARGRGKKKEKIWERTHA